MAFSPHLLDKTGRVAFSFEPFDSTFYVFLLFYSNDEHGCGCVSSQTYTAKMKRRGFVLGARVCKLAILDHLTSL